MTLKNLNLNNNKLRSYNKAVIKNKSIAYGSEKSHSDSVNLQDSVNFSKKTSESLKTSPLRQQISFKGSFFKAAEMKKFFLGEESILAKELLADITKYIEPNKENSFVLSLAYDVNNKKSGIANDLIHPHKPFYKNLWESFIDLPKLIINYSKKIFGNEKTKEKINKQFSQEEARNTLLGFWMNVMKLAGDFDKKITGSNLDELKNILKKGVVGNEKELSNFFGKGKLKSVYSFKDGKASGILAKSDDKGNHLEEFAKEILNDTPREEGSFIEKAKKEYVQQTIDKITETKQGYILPNFGTSANQFIARAVSGTIPAWFIAKDFYNLKILNTNDKNQAEKERKSKFKQETTRIALDTYQGYILNSVFEKLTNKSLPFALGVNIVNSIGSNVFSRLITKRPVLPITVEKAEKLNLEKAQKAQKAAELQKNKSAIGFGASNNGIINSIKSGMKALDKRFANAKICRATMTVEQFTKGYERVSQLDTKDARKMLEIAANRINETAGEDKKIKKAFSQLTLDDILNHSHIKEQKEIVIGRNWIYRYSKEAVNIVKFPFEFAATLGRAVISPVLKLIGKKPLEAKKKGSFYSEQFVKNITGWADKINKKMETIDDSNLEEAISRYGKNKNFFSTKVMEYGTNELSTAMKLTGFTTVPFLAVDAYNVNLSETKDKNSSSKKSHERAIQDSSRQGISLWICYAFNQMGKAISNASLLGNALVIGLQAFSYESLTRLVVGQPLSITTHEKMVEIEKEKSKSKNWFVKLMAGRLKTNSAPVETQKQPQS